MSRKLPPARTRLAVLCACLALSVSAFAQSQATTGNIEGRVLDPQQAVVAGATVTAGSLVAAHVRRSPTRASQQRGER